MGPLIVMKNTLFLLIASTLLLSCGNPYEESRNERAETAKKGTGDVVVAVVWPPLTPPVLFSEGVDLAVREINEKGGVLGRRLRIIRYQDTGIPGGDFDAERIANDTDVVAVVGHYHSDSTLSSLITYEYHGILLLIAAATNPVLLEQGFEYVFRAVPDDAVYGERLARYAYRTGYKRIAVIDNSTFYGKGLAAIFHQRASELGMEIVIHRGYAQWQHDYRSLIAQLRNLDFDAVFLAGILPQAGSFIKQLRQMGVNTPVLAGDSLDSQDFIDIAGDTANGTVVPTFFRPQPSDPHFLSFQKAFHDTYNRNPDQFAPLGYDSIYLLDHAMTTSGSTVPLVVASTLRHTAGWEGVLGDYSFEETGELSGRNIFFKQVRDGKFVHIEE